MTTGNRWMSGPAAALAMALGLAAAAPDLAARDGSRDLDFASAGKAILPFPGNLFIANQGMVEVAMLPSGQMIVAGTVINANGDDDFAAIRLNAGGTLDTGYGASGGRRVGFDRAGSSLNDVVYGLLVQPDGKAVLVGEAAGDDATGNRDMALVRLTAAGALDSTFGTNGRVLVPFNVGPLGSRDDRANRVSRQSDGKLLVAGTVDRGGGSRDMAVVRLNANGVRDTTFDGDGRVTIDFGPDYTSSEGLQVRQLANGQGILVAGIAGLQLQGSDFALARLNADGSLDPAFGDGGKVTFDFAVGGNHSDFAFDFVETPDGKLVVCGYVEVNAPINTDMGCMRFLADGSPDPDFPAVVVPFDRGANLIDLAGQVVRDRQGRLVLAGGAQTDVDNSDFALARLLPDGDLDPSFGNGGTVTHNSCTVACVIGSERNNIASSVVLQPDGKIVTAGIVADANGNYRFMIMRLFGDGIFGHGFEP